jgi:hypothetical protein
VVGRPEDDVWAPEFEIFASDLKTSRASLGGQPGAAVPTCAATIRPPEHGTLAALPGTVASPPFARAVSGFGHFSIGADASLRVQTPEQAFVGRWHGGIGLGEDELPFPAQRGAEIWVFRVEALGFALHAAPPAAFKMARLTATRARWTL